MFDYNYIRQPLRGRYVWNVLNFILKGIYSSGSVVVFEITKKYQINKKKSTKALNFSTLVYPVLYINNLFKSNIKLKSFFCLFSFCKIFSMALSAGEQTSTEIRFQYYQFSFDFIVNTINLSHQMENYNFWLILIAQFFSNSLVIYFYNSFFFFCRLI